MLHDLAGVSFGNPSLNLFQMPLLCVQIRLHSFAEKVGTVAVEGVGQRVQCGYFVGFKAEANGLLFHNAS